MKMFTLVLALALQCVIGFELQSGRSLGAVRQRVAAPTTTMMGRKPEAAQNLEQLDHDANAFRSGCCVLDRYIPHAIQNNRGRSRRIRISAGSCWGTRRERKMLVTRAKARDSNPQSTP